MNQGSVCITRAGLDDLDALVPLFDAYRLFYEQPADLDLAREFMTERLSNMDSVVLLARRDQQAVGFTQLYPSFSSTRARRIFILNDLFVAGEARGSGIAANLLNAAVEFAREEGALRLTLSTARSNMPAQRLYERLGWTLDDVFLTYSIATSAEQVSQTVGSTPPNSPLATLACPCVGGGRCAGQSSLACMGCQRSLA